MSETTSPRTVLLPGGTYAVQTRQAGPVEAVAVLALPGEWLYLDCTCGCHGRVPTCTHAALVGDRLVRDGLARPDGDGYRSTAGLAPERA